MWEAVDIDGDGRIDVSYRLSSDRPKVVVLKNTCSSPASPATSRRSILSTVVSRPGANGSYFRTELRLENRTASPLEGRLVFHPTGRGGSDGDPGMDFVLEPEEVRVIPDVLEAIGTPGNGSLDIFGFDGKLPVARAAIRDDRGTGEAVEEAVLPTRALETGERGLLRAPAGLDTHRFAIGYRAMAAGASISFVVRNKSGERVHSWYLDVGPSIHRQGPAGEVLGGYRFVGGETVDVSVVKGAVIVYGTIADNATNTPRLQVLTR